MLHDRFTFVHLAQHPLEQLAVFDQRTLRHLNSMRRVPRAA
jgi:hypothetical protein